MLRVMITDLWRRSAWLYVLLACLATLAPLRLAMAVGALDPGPAGSALDLLQNSAGYGALHATIAALGGLLLGAGVWQSDQAAGHVYALTLPTPRWHYALLRYASGAIVVGAFAAAFWIGALIAVSFVSLPFGVHAYPSALAVRFALTALLAFSLFFTLSALTTRTAAVILLGLAGLMITEVALSAAGAGWSLLDLLSGEHDWLLTSGRWMLFDV